MLRFGLQSALKIFSALADGLQWILAQNGITHLLHYLDDFIFVAASMEELSRQKDIFVSTCTPFGDVQIGWYFHLFEFCGHQSGLCGKSAAPTCEEITQAETRIDSLPPS